MALKRREGSSKEGLSVMFALQSPPATAALTQAPLAASSAIASSGDVTPYPLSYFAQFRPNTAFDMIGRLPGFVFTSGQTARGYEGTAGNVLINGNRPPTKTDSLQDILTRLPANTIQRIDVIRGGSTSLDTLGYSVIANVVTKKDTDSRTFSVYGKSYSEAFTGYGARVDVTKDIGRHSLSASAFLYREEGTDAGTGSYTGSIPQYGLTATRRIFESEPEDGFNLKLDDQYRGATDSLESKLDYEYLTIHENQAGAGATGTIIGQDFLALRDTTNKLEFSEEWKRNLPLGIRLTLLGLQSLEHEGTVSNSTLVGTNTDYNRLAKSGETILRAKFEGDIDKRTSFNFGAEAVYNFLDSAADVSVAGSPIDLPGGTAKVKEYRAESFATLTWTPKTWLHAEVGLRVETSQITTSSVGSTISEHFTFPKPRLEITYNLTKADQLRGRVEREVGQLDFTDFAASADLTRGIISAGNANLQPQRDWIYEAAWEHRLSARGSIVLTASHSDIQDVLDQVLLNGDSAAGNIPTGTEDLASVALTQPLDHLGLHGGLISLSETWRRSAVIDPLTGQTRRISGETPHEGVITLSQDLPALRSTWTVTMTEANGQTTFYANELEAVRVGRTIDTSWEYKPRSGLSLLFQIKNLFGRRRSQDEVLYSPDRGQPALEEQVAQQLNFGPYLYVRLRANF